MSKNLLLVVGPPGSGKSTLAQEYVEKGYIRISQDVSGREHLALFDEAILEGKDVFVDRLNFSKGQRSRYLDIAKSKGYTTKIIVLHQSYEVCFERVMARQGHETIRDEKAARSALGMFFSKYERVQDSEADEVVRMWPDNLKPPVIWSDLDGTLCDCNHRRKFVRPDKPPVEGEPLFKKDWTAFFKAMAEDRVNLPVMETLRRFAKSYSIVYCSGRPSNYRLETEKWLKDTNAPDGLLFMRPRNDSRQDDIVKEILLDFEVLTRFTPFFFLDDRDQVVKMLRKRGFIVFQVAEGNF
jgi:predicted kinase